MNPIQTQSALKLTRRLRRLRTSETLRAMVRETRLSPDMFILPLFVCEGEGVRREAVVSAAAAAGTPLRSLSTVSLRLAITCWISPTGVWRAATIVAMKCAISRSGVVISVMTATKVGAGALATFSVFAGFSAGLCAGDRSGDPFSA